jgi:hypothetical protein
VSQLIPHDVPLQVADPFAGTAHGEVHVVPQVATAEFDAHVLPHG